SYLESGADVLITASYQASVEGFRRELGVSEVEARDLIGRSVTLAREARSQFISENVTTDTPVGREVQIAGSVGPYGACQHDGSEYTGDYVDHMTQQELEVWHRPRLRTLVECGVDLVACETLPALTEALALVHLLTTEFTDTMAWISFSCRNGTETCHGEEFREAVKTVMGVARERGKRDGNQQVVAVGVNCSDPNYIQVWSYDLVALKCSFV
ncbi:Homocysteine S-methyltransferase 1, partial [Geodia barretti]